MDTGEFIGETTRDVDQAATALRLEGSSEPLAQGSLVGSATLGWGAEFRWDSNRGRLTGIVEGMAVGGAFKVWGQVLGG